MQELATAVWWPDSSQHPHRRTLHGEIHLSAGLKPTCRLGKFELAVSALLLYCARASFEVLTFRDLLAGSTLSWFTRPRRLHSSPRVAATPSSNGNLWSSAPPTHRVPDQESTPRLDMTMQAPLGSPQSFVSSIESKRSRCVKRVFLRPSGCWRAFVYTLGGLPCPTCGIITVPTRALRETARFGLAPM